MELPAHFLLDLDSIPQRLVGHQNKNGNHAKQGKHKDFSKHFYEAHVANTEGSYEYARPHQLEQVATCVWIERSKF